MTHYRRARAPGAIWFFTVNLAERGSNRLLVEHVDALRQAFAYTRRQRPFRLDAVVILPDHLHCIWSLPDGDSDYSTRWNLLKGHFSRALEKSEYVSPNRRMHRERGIWQRRFWEYLIRDEDDFNHHLDYIHWNPVKHGWAQRVIDWPHSSFHRLVEQGFYSPDWGGGSNIQIKGDQ
ncbi:MAG TPA: transposase [Plasticicumulans sp.]|nr:transposase [Plasticicumulans sp.]